MLANFKIFRPDVRAIVLGVTAPYFVSLETRITQVRWTYDSTPFGLSRVLTAPLRYTQTHTLTLAAGTRRYVVLLCLCAMNVPGAAERDCYRHVVFMFCQVLLHAIVIIMFRCVYVYDVRNACSKCAYISVCSLHASSSPPIGVSSVSMSRGTAMMWLSYFLHLLPDTSLVSKSKVV